MNPNLPSPSEQLEARLVAAARAFPYPPTPDLTAPTRRRVSATRTPRRAQLGWALAMLLVIVLGALASTVPQVRAALVEFIRVGVVRIFLAPPTPTPTATPLPAASARRTPMPLATPRPTAALLPSLLNLAGETTLAEAQRQFPDPIRLPAEWGEPDRIFIQEQGNFVVILVWLEPDDPKKVRLALFEFGPESWGMEKLQPTLEATAEVNGRPAVWARGPYLVILRNGEVEERRLIDGHVLIWTEAEITYRLETDLSLDEAVRVAESLR